MLRHLGTAGRRVACRLTTTRALSMLSAEAESEARQRLCDFPGGCVTLQKNEENGIATIVLDRPERNNAMSGQMFVQLSDVVSELAQWKGGRGLLLHGAGGNFCAGTDYAMERRFLGGPSSEGLNCIAFMRDVLTRLHDMPLVSVALLRGKTLGAGAEMALACDFRIMAENAVLGFIHARQGVTPALGSASRLQKLIGRRQSLSLLSRANRLSWSEAMDLGLIEALLPDNDKFTKGGRRWIERHLPEEPKVAQVIKRMAVAVANEQDLDKALHIESHMFGALCGSPEKHQPW